MKYILILLVSITFGISQTQEEIQEWLDSYPNSFSKTYWSVPDNWYISILKYAEECYNDSTEIDRHIGNMNNCMFVSYGYGSSGCLFENHYDIKVWTHETPTFGGFIEWIKQ